MTPSLKPLIIIFCALAFILLPIQAQAARCQAPKTTLGFKPTVSKTKFNISESAFDLHKMHGGAQAGLVTGLALSPLYYEFQGQFKITKQDNGYCLAMDKIRLYYRARPMVFVSSEFPRGSCEFKAVLRHENKHVRALKTTHGRTASAFKKHAINSLEQIRPVGPVSRAQIKSAQKKMQKQLAGLLDSYLKQANADLAREQNKIDSPSEYERVSGQCQNWTSRLRLQ